MNVRPKSDVRLKRSQGASETSMAEAPTSSAPLYITGSRAHAEAVGLQVALG